MNRLAIDASPLLPATPSAALSGIARTTLEFIRALSAADLPFEVILFGQRFRGPRLSSMGMGFPVRQIPLPRHSWVERAKTTLPIVEVLTRHDLFHATANFAYIRNPERAIVTIHDAMFLAYPEPFLGHDLEAERIPPFVRRCRAIITCSEASKNDIVRLMDVSPEKVYVLPWGVRHDLFRPHPDPAALYLSLDNRFGIRRPYFLQVSCDVGRKNSPLVFESYRALLKHDPDHDLVLVWRKPPSEILAAHAQPSIRERVHLLSAVSDADLRLLYCGATATLFPSAYEGFGLPVLESMACATPVITSRSSSLPEVGGQAAIYISLEQPNALMSEMIAFEEGRYDRAVLSKSCVQRASEFTWSKYVSQIVPIYERYLN